MQTKPSPDQASDVEDQRADLYSAVSGPGGGRDHHQLLLAVLPRLDADDAREGARLLSQADAAFLFGLLSGRGDWLCAGRVPRQMARGAGMVGSPSTDGDVPGLCHADRTEAFWRRSCQASWILLLVLLVIGFGSLGQFPTYYAFTQELSVRKMGKVTGVLSFVTWISWAVVSMPIGRWIDRTGSYAAVTFLAGLVPLLGLVALVLFWNRPGSKSPLPTMGLTER